MQQQHYHEVQKQQRANEEMKNQTADMREEIRQLKEQMISDGGRDLKRVEKKVTSLTAKIASIEASMMPTQDGGDNLPNQSV